MLMLTYTRNTLIVVAILIMVTFSWNTAYAHNVTPGDAGYVQEIWGVHIIPFMYLGAKHMVTGYDHILFLFGVIFFLYRFRDVAIYVSLFAVGHSITMLVGVWFGWGVNAYIVDAIIGFSVVYKALDNLDVFQNWFGYQSDTKAMTFMFGLVHGTGLATKILEYQISEEGLLPNLLAFNVGVEIGQILALCVILIAMGYLRRMDNFRKYAISANVVMIFLGLALMTQHIFGYLHSHTH